MKEPRLRLLNELRTFIRLNEFPVSKRFIVEVDGKKYKVRLQLKQPMLKYINKKGKVIYREPFK